MTWLRRLFLALPNLLAAESPRTAQTSAHELPAAAANGDEEAFERPVSAARRLNAAWGPYPAVVQRALDEGRQTGLVECTGFVPSPCLVRTGDLTGDGHVDYIVDFR